MPPLFYTLGTRIPIEPSSEGTDSFEIIITESSIITETFTAAMRSEGRHHIFNIILRSGTDIASPDIQQRIDKGIKLVARKIAPGLLIPRARSIAESLGLTVDKLETAHGHCVLGTCYPRQRRIRLSYINVFLPAQLRDYIICHELAHLTEPGHTPAFHSLCDSYCRDYCESTEKQLRHRLRTFRWPVKR